VGKTYFGFGLSDSMFPTSPVTISRRDISAGDVREMVRAGVVSCLNPTHAASIAVMRERFGLDVPIPEKAPIVALVPGDSLIVMGISGLPRLEGRHEYTSEEVAEAKFRFGLYEIWMD
jgi:hypothetical protein